jgi:hypothetical protein
MLVSVLSLVSAIYSAMFASIVTWAHNLLPLTNLVLHVPCNLSGSVGAWALLLNLRQSTCLRDVCPYLSSAEPSWLCEVGVFACGPLLSDSPLCRLLRCRVLSFPCCVPAVSGPAKGHLFPYVAGVHCNVVACVPRVTPLCRAGAGGVSADGEGAPGECVSF